jgi:hypothetical protein
MRPKSFCTIQSYAWILRSVFGHFRNKILKGTVPPNCDDGRVTHDWESTDYAIHKLYCKALTLDCREHHDKQHHTALRPNSCSLQRTETQRGEGRAAAAEGDAMRALAGLAPWPVDGRPLLAPTSWVRVCLSRPALLQLLIELMERKERKF